MLTKDDEGREGGVSQKMTIADEGGGGGQANDDDCWRGVEGGSKNVHIWLT